MTYWLYGFHSVEAALNHPERRIKRVLVSDQQAPKLQALAQTRKLKCEIAKPTDIEKYVGKDAVHQGVAALVENLEPLTLDDVVTKSEKPILVLDQVTDPHNVGAMLRTAAAFDVACVIVQERHSPQESGVLAKAASGALDIVPMVYVTNISNALLELKDKGYWVVGLDGHTKTTFQEAKLKRNTALVMGAEGEGLRRLVAERCDQLVKFPISSRMESLNVSNACAIGLYLLANS